MCLRPKALLVLPVLLGGCLQEGPQPAGVHLFHSQKLASPGFIRIGDEDMIRFIERGEPATLSRGATRDLWITSFDGSRQRKVVSNWSDYWGKTEAGPYNAGDRYFMVDEHLVQSEGGMARVANLIRLGPTLEKEWELDGIWTFERFTTPIGTLIEEPQPEQTCPGFPELQNNCPQILFERPALPGQAFPQLYLWNGEQELVLGSDSGSFQHQIMGDGTIYFVLGEKRTLTRLVRPINLVESLRADVWRFSVSGDQRYVALAVTDEGKSKTIVLDLQEKKEIPLAQPNPSAWGGFGGDTFYYSQNATTSGPAELHSLDLLTGEDTFETVPSPLVNLVGSLSRCDDCKSCDYCDERLLLDSLGQGVFTSKNDFVARRRLAGPLLTPSFTKDGKYLIYIAPAAATLYDTSPQGALMFQDAELSQPPIMVSPPGLLVSADQGPAYFFTEGDNGPVLVFWSRLGRASSDLYFADYPGDGLPTNLRRMAEAILSVSISVHSLFGIVDMSQQDGVGDLVYMNFDTGTDIFYAHAVSEAAQLGGDDLASSYAAYVVRGRVDSDRSGLWLTSMADPATTDGGP